jgi:hypothetical protein
MSRGDGTTTVDYVWDVAGGLPMLLQDGTNTGACPERSRRVYGLGLIAIYDGSEMTYRLVDGLGSTVNLCDQDGEQTMYTGCAHRAFSKSGALGSNSFSLLKGGGSRALGNADQRKLALRGELPF